MKTHSFNLGDFRRLTAHLPDDTAVLARDRDCISASILDIVGPVAPGVEVETGECFSRVVDPVFSISVNFVKRIEDVYGGKNSGLGKVTTAVVLCGCD